VFTDAGVSIDATNYPNMFTSYYPYGGAIALAIDLELRSKFNKSLDDVMRVLWQKHGKTEIPYTVPDVQAALAATTGNNAYAADFFAKYIYGHDPIDYSQLFAPANYAVKKANAGKAWLGRVVLDSGRNGITVQNNTVLNTPLYTAGVDVNDVLLELDGQKLFERKDVEEILRRHKPGDSISISFRHRNNTINRALKLAEDPAVKIEDATPASTDKQLLFRKEWMDAKGTLM
jgi:predicted metalloprotease with PDZ domain